MSRLLKFQIHSSVRQASSCFQFRHQLAAPWQLRSVKLQYQKRQKPLVMSGIGTGSQMATHEVWHSVGLPESGDALYRASELPNSATPAILGQNSLAEKCCLVDCAQKRMYAVGPGGYEIRLSPGGVMYPLNTSREGHLMLPCAEYGRGQASTEFMTFVVGHTSKSGRKGLRRLRW